ncbi:MAG: exopolysaccharide biosynthesis polyprenyl glycosylphosphotransferase, partial [Bulleidia sp.]|nr:exopolysaccharide biosynthesis polyprenyl glycosylphosphotransferase [Bulleidia sp.]
GKYVYRGACAIILTLIALVAFYIEWRDFVEVNNQTGHLTGLGNIGMALGIYGLLYIIIGRGLKAFKIGVNRISNVLASQVLTLLTVNCIEIFVSMAITGEFRFFWKLSAMFLIVFCVQSVVICSLVIPMIGRYRKLFPPLKLIEIYGEKAENLLYKFIDRPDKYIIAKSITFSDIASIAEEIDNFDAVLINDLPANQKNRILKLCFEKDKRVYFTPKLSDILVKGAEELNLFDTPLYLRRNNGIPIWKLAVKRFFDIVLSVFTLVVLSPVLLIVALAIKHEDGGPVFFKQERCTIGGKKFMILKFRSMIVDAEKDGRPHPVTEDDDRITKVGKVIRACRIDELPQLINILKGDMSIVGPRPERVEHVERYKAMIPEFAFREKMKGGLTGYAQVYGKYNTTALDKLKLDLMYITNYSLLLDVQIIFETVKILFQKESTEGFSEAQEMDIHDFNAEHDDH